MGMEEDAFLTGGARPREPAPARKYAAEGGGGRATLFLFVLPWLMFTFIMLLFTFAYFHDPVVCWTGSLVCVVLACIFGSLGSAEQRQYTFLAILCLLAVASSTLLGMINCSWHMAPYFFYEEAREYHNVLPSEPAAAHGDAGKLLFASVAKIDTTKAVGYKVGDVYCVAPIMDSYSGARVEYWAVGVNCCEQRGGFSCDDAMKESNSARGGLVVQDVGLFRQSPFDYYHKAVHTAEAQYDLVSSSEPLFVRWVADPDELQNGFFLSGVGNLAGWTCFYGALNAGLAYLANSVLRKRR